MSKPIIIVENLGKKYLLHHQQNRQKYLSLRDVMADRTKALVRRGVAAACTLSGKTPRVDNNVPSTEDFWALRDVSFQVHRGESVGIIGRNGAGKSTLLKILSRITEPTTGGFRLRGRMASLLEVGTGFHQELSGRENIYLNGAILGMSRAEIKSKFDEIVAFAEVEKFLDTPVKRYSSGMYVRLAFAVAAHLEPDILVVDEVLAVGDAEFQRKCLGKMGEVARGGKTVLFVSHNMAAIQNLCSRGILLKNGQIEISGSVADAIGHYMSVRDHNAQVPFAVRTDHEGDGRIRIVDLTLNGQSASGPVSVRCGDQLVFGMKFRVIETVIDPVVYLTIWDSFGLQILHMNTSMAGVRMRLDKPGLGAQCIIPRLPLPPGRYTVNAAVWADGGWVDRMESVVILNVEVGPFFPSTDTAAFTYGKCLVDHIWSEVRIPLEKH